MKNLIKHSLAVVALFTALLGNANSSLNDLNDDKRTTIRLNDVKQGDQLFIKDIYGIILYKEKIQNSGMYVKGFDLTELPDGSYFFELDNNLKIKIIPFEVSINNVVFNKENETIFYKPIITNKENKVFISKLSLNKEPLKVKVYYKNDNLDYELIYTETICNQQSLGRVINLNKDKKGIYKIVSFTEGRTFTDYVQL